MAKQKTSKKESKSGRTSRKVERVKSPLRGFVNFVREQGVVGLAIGFVLGAQSKTLVDQLVESFINPLLGLLLPGSGSLDERTFSVTMGGQTEVFSWGAFVDQLISFLIIAAIIYFIFKGLKLDKLDKPKS
jgi:large conductance mechanosensitive channel